MVEFTEQDRERIAAELFLMRLDRPNAPLLDHPEIVQLWGSNQMDAIEQVKEEYNHFKDKVKFKIMAGEI